MKFKVLLVTLLAVVGLWYANRVLNQKPRYMDSAPSVAEVPGGEVRAEFKVGFLPVT